MRHMTGGNDATESPRVPGRRRVVERCAADQERWGYPALTEASRRKILGLNSAGLYKLPGASEASAHGVYKPVPQNFESQIPNSLLTLLEYQGVADDNFSKMRKQYVEMGGGRSNTRYGWLRTKA